MRDSSRQWNTHLWTILMIGCLLGLSACADLMSESTDGNTAAVRKDLSSGSNPNQVDDSGSTWFGFDPGSTPLTVAAQNGHYDVVKLLLEYGADPNQVAVIVHPTMEGVMGGGLVDGHPLYVSRNSVTPLFMAAQNQNYDVVKLLLEYGANPEEEVKVNEMQELGFHDPDVPGQIGVSLSLDQVWATAVANGISSSQIDFLRKSFERHQVGLRARLTISCQRRIKTMPDGIWTANDFRICRKLKVIEKRALTHLTHQLFPEIKNTLLTRARKALLSSGNISLSGKAIEFYRDLNRPQSKNFDAYNNEYLWTEKGSPISQKWGRYYEGSRDELQFLAVSERIIQGDYLEEVWDRMQGESPPELDIKQSKFESTRHYIHREESAKEQLTSYQKTLSSNERKAYETVELREKLIVYRLFVLYFGRPIITNISYDPDTRLFGIRVEGKNGGIFRFTFADRIMNEVAPAYEKKIRKASVKILLRASGGRLYIDGGSLLFTDGTSERILPFHEEEYHPKDVTIASFPKIMVPKFSPPEKILSNERMKSEGKKIVRDTVYFQGLK